MSKYISDHPQLTSTIGGAAVGGLTGALLDDGSSLRGGLMGATTGAAVGYGGYELLQNILKDKKEIISSIPKPVVVAPKSKPVVVAPKSKPIVVAPKSNPVEITQQDGNIVEDVAAQLKDRLKGLFYTPFVRVDKKEEARKQRERNRELLNLRISDLEERSKTMTLEQYKKLTAEERGYIPFLKKSRV